MEKNKSASERRKERDSLTHKNNFNEVKVPLILRKHLFYDDEKISGTRYFFRFLIISIVFIWPSMILDNSFFRIILFILFSYMFSVVVYKRCNSIKFSRIIGAIWGFSVIWFSVLLNYQQIDGIGLITTVPHLILIFKNGFSDTTTVLETKTDKYPKP